MKRGWREVISEVWRGFWPKFRLCLIILHSVFFWYSDDPDVRLDSLFLVMLFAFDYVLELIWTIGTKVKSIGDGVDEIHRMTVADHEQRYGV